RNPVAKTPVAKKKLARNKESQPPVEVIDVEGTQAEEEVSLDDPEVVDTEAEVSEELDDDLKDDLDDEFGEPSADEEFDEDAPEGSRALVRASSSDTALSPLDPLAAYMREVQRHPLLTREEEHQLAVLYHETGNVDAAKKLVTSNLRLVVKIAYEYKRAYKNMMDLVQEGNIGLMQAVKHFDPHRGVKLSS